MKENPAWLPTECYDARTLRRRQAEQKHLRQALGEIARLAVWDRDSSGHRARETFTKIRQIVSEALGKT